MKSGEAAEQRRRAALLHMGHYRLSLIEVLGRHFYGTENGVVKSKNVDNLLAPLRKRELIRSVRFEDSATVYYQLTTAGAKLVNLPKSVANPLNADPLRKLLAILWFSWLGNRPRYRISAVDLEQLLSSVTPKEHEPMSANSAAFFGHAYHRIHCIQQYPLRAQKPSSQRPKKKGVKKSHKSVPPRQSRTAEYAIWRVRIIDGAKPLEKLYEQLQIDHDEACAVPELADWLADRKYRFMVLSPNREAVKQIKYDGRKRKEFQAFRVDAEFAPDPTQVAQALRELKNGR